MKSAKKPLPPFMMKKGEAKMASGGMAKVRTAAPSRDGIAAKGKTKGTMIKMKRGGACK